MNPVSGARSTGPLATSDLLEATQDMLFRYRLWPTRGFEYVSDTALAMTGFLAEQFLGDPDLMTKLNADLHGSKGWLEDPETQLPVDEWRLRKRDGRLIWVRQWVRQGRDEAGRLVFVEGVLRDVAVEKGCENGRRRHRQAIDAVMRGLQVLRSTESTTDLLPAICRTLQEEGGYHLVWIGVPQNDERRSVLAVAKAGAVAYLDEADITWGDSASGMGPVGTAIRHGQTVVIDDIRRDPRDPWRVLANRHGLGSVVSIPVDLGGVRAALALYGEEASRFSEEEVVWLTEVALCLEARVVALRERAELKQVQSTLRLVVHVHQTMLNAAPVMMASLDDAGNVLTWNRAAQEMLGVAEEEVIGRPIKEFLDVQEESQHHLLEMLAKGDNLNGEELCLQGTPKGCTTIRLFASPFRPDADEAQHRILIGVDVTDVRQARSAEQASVKQLSIAFEETISAIRTLGELRDPYTAGHERRVGELAASIGRMLGMSLQQQYGLRVAGYLHDIGKIVVPSELLSKPARLSPIEMDLVRTHAQAGYDILSGVHFPWPVAGPVLQHHERLDGSGYPLGLKGDDICLEARILGVADVVEAMASHRPYRPAVGFDQAMAELMKGRGVTYDSAVVDTCLRVFEDDVLDPQLWQKT